MKEINTKRGWVWLVMIVLCWMLIFSLAKDFNKVKQGFRRIDEATLKLKAEEEKNLSLKKKMVYAQSDYYKEKVVRDKLNLQKPGEIVVVLPGAGGLGTKEDSIDTENIAKSDLRNWEKWLKVVQN